MRATIARNPTDVDVTVPANGFNLAGTLTTPPTVADRLRSPAIVLVGGSGPTDRDETVVGIPIFTQLAKALADNGFIVLRYDKRGVGQSGGRTETATLSDYADDVVSAVRWMSRRNDIDPRKIVVCGHSEGGAVALIAAGREKKIDGVVAIASPGETGADLILAQQSHLLDTLKASEADKQSKIELQKKIQAAVVSGSGWEGIPEDLRKQADTPWFKSLLTFDPAEALGRAKQPLLIVQGDLDTAGRSGKRRQACGAGTREKESRRRRSRAHPGDQPSARPGHDRRSVGIRHAEGPHVSPKVAESIVEWVKRTF